MDLTSSLPQPRVAAVFATMNRAETAIACVLSLARQTSPPEWVLVADNRSTDDTMGALASLENLPFELVVHAMPENLGNAGGVHAVMELAFSRGADAVWILDDDSWPRAASLEAMLDGPWDPHVVRHPLQIDPQSGKFTWPLQIHDGSSWRLIWSEPELPDGPRIRTRISWTGALLPKEVRDVIGPVNGDLFIRGEDEEYPWRMEQFGFPQEAIRAAVMDHPGPQNVVHWKLFGKSFFFERGLADWKLYYKVRNMIWLKRRQTGDLAAMRMAGAYAFAAIVIDGWKRVPLLHRAISDGWRGRLGKM